MRAHGEAYRLAHVLAPAERKAFDAILACRTARLGGHLDVCDACGHAAPSYNSCRNRHCPKCQSLRQARWIEARKERLLPVHYFHVVFTMPAQLRGLARRNPVALYDLLFAAASRTLLALGADPARLGGTLGITAVLHTWTRALALHPHLHCIVTGGGLAPGGAAWVSARRKHLFPVRVLSRLYRGKFLAALSDAYAAGELDLSGSAAPLADPAAFSRLKDTLYRTEWVVYAKRPFGGAAQVFSYLGRYTHRVGISNQRLRALDAGGVHFATKSGQAITLAPAEFIRRFLLHILPAHFVKIRHYGVLAAGNVHTKL
ncbi:MAG: IS91 family transposase, partial [Candidatus Rokuibacteriota bacterium]